MNNSPLVSIILPTYNRCHYIKKAIESALVQTHKNFEFVIVDDCSSDGTSSLLKTYAQRDARIIIVRNEKNVGLVKSLNKGIQHAKGMYIARLDDDDVWCDTQKLEKQVAFLEKNPEYVLVGGGQIRIDEKGKEISRFLLPENDRDIRNFILQRNPFTHTSVLFRKETWKKVGGYDESLIFSEDWDLWLKFGRIGKLYNFQEYFVDYLWGSQNRSNEHMVRDALINMKLRIRYRKSFPGFFKAFFRGCLAVAYAILPFRLLMRRLFS